MWPCAGRGRFPVAHNRKNGRRSLAPTTILLIKLREPTNNNGISNIAH